VGSAIALFTIDHRPQSAQKFHFCGRTKMGCANACHRHNAGICHHAKAGKVYNHLLRYHIGTHL